MTATSDRLTVSAAFDGAFVLAGELDMETLPVARDLVDEFRVPGRAVVLDLAGITFLDSMVIHWLVELAEATEKPVVIRNAPDSVRLVLAVADILGSDGDAWFIDDAQQHALAMKVIKSNFGGSWEPAS